MATRPLTRLCRAAALVAVAQPTAACSHIPARYADAPPVLLAADTVPSAVPKRTRFLKGTHLSDVYLRRPVVDALETTRFPRALDVNAIDEVPRSSWFDPLEGRSARALERAFAQAGAPSGPLRVRRGGPQIEPGALVVEDALGKRFELVRDPEGRPGTRTAAVAIAARLVRAAGWRAPEAHVVDLRTPPKPGWEHVAAVRWPAGIDVGPTPEARARSDDPNDLVPHRDRRTLRALGVLAAWLDARLLGPETTRDVYEGERGFGHVKHYVVGLSAWLGAHRTTAHVPEPLPVGQVSGNAFLNLVTFGLVPEPPETEPSPDLRAFPPQFNAERWKPRHPYEPRDRMLADDAYWAAKRLLAIDERTLRWAVRSGGIEDEAVRKHLVDALKSRRRDVAAWAFGNVTPCELESASGRSLAFQDLAVELGVEPKGGTIYAVAFLDDDGDELADTIAVRPAGSTFAIDVPPKLSGYVVVRVLALRGGTDGDRAMEVHVMIDAAGLRVVGVRH